MVKGAQFIVRSEKGKVNWVMPKRLPGLWQSQAENMQQSLL
jgi:hypothetical protein